MIQLEIQIKFQGRPQCFCVRGVTQGYKITSTTTQYHEILPSFT